MLKFYFIFLVFHLLAESDEIKKLKETVNQLQSETRSIAASNNITTNPIEETSNMDYKRRWEEAETKYRSLEKKYYQLENVTVKQLQDKVDQLQRDNNQFKVSI